MRDHAVLVEGVNYGAVVEHRREESVPQPRRVLHERSTPSVDLAGQIWQRGIGNRGSWGQIQLSTPLAREASDATAVPTRGVAVTCERTVRVVLAAEGKHVGNPRFRQIFMGWRGARGEPVAARLI